MLKVLLAYRCPDEGFDDPRFAALPSGLPWLAAAVREAGADPTVANFSRLSWKDVERFLGELRPDLVGLSAWPGNRRECGRLFRLARKASPGAALLAGGPLVDEQPRELLTRWREADGLLLGEAERTLGRACSAVAAEGRGGLAGLPGFVGRDGGAGLRPPPPADLDGLPAPEAGGVLAGVEPERDLRWIVATRGRAEGPPALRSPGSVARELLERRKVFGLVDVSLLGPGLAADRSLLPALAAALQDAKCGARWEMGAEPEDLLPRSEPARDRELLRHALRDAAAAGCRRVRLSLWATGGALSRRRQDLAAVSETLRSAGLLPVLTLRVGDPALPAGEEIDELRALVRALRPVDCELEVRHLPPQEAPPAAEDEELTPEALAEEARRRLQRVGEALEPTIRDVRRGARPGPRELESRRVRGGGGAWLDVDWGDYRAGSGDLDEARRHYRLAAEAEPWSIHPWLRLARLASRRSDRGAEAEALREVLHRVPRHAAARERLDELRGERPRGRRRPRRRIPGPGGGA